MYGKPKKVSTAGRCDIFPSAVRERDITNILCIYPPSLPPVVQGLTVCPSRVLSLSSQSDVNVTPLPQTATFSMRDRRDNRPSLIRSIPASPHRVWRVSPRASSHNPRLPEMFTSCPRNPAAEPVPVSFVGPPKQTANRRRGYPRFRLRARLYPGASSA